jgi:hypothetical protein
MAVALAWAAGGCIAVGALAIALAAMGAVATAIGAAGPGFEFAESWPPTAQQSDGVTQVAS